MKTIYNLYIRCYNNTTKEVIYEGLRQSFDNMNEANETFNKILKDCRKSGGVNSHGVRKFSPDNCEKHFYVLDGTIYKKVILKRIRTYEQ